VEHFVGYHNSDKRGSWEHPLKKGTTGAFMTKRKFHEATIRGNRLWMIVGDQSPKRYRLMAAATMERITPWRPGRWRRVDYKVDANVQPDDVSDLPWFKKQRGLLQFGLRKITDRRVITEFEALQRNRSASAIDASRRQNSAKRQNLYADLCVYTIKKLRDIDEFSRAKGLHSIKTGQTRWVRAKKIILDAGTHGKVVPLLFADAGDTREVKACADLVSVNIGATNKFTFKNLKYIEPIRKTALKKAEGGTIPASYIHGYVICRTPKLRFRKDPPPRVQRSLVDEEFHEGEAIQVVLTRYERNPAARERCIRHYGTTCMACGLSFAEQYGPETNKLIHVHHLKPIATVGVRSSNPVRDLRPVCPNCHAVIHLTKPPRTIEQVKRMVRKQLHARAR
jgi:hypothetical protein